MGASALAPAVLEEPWHLRDDEVVKDSNPPPAGRLSGAWSVSSVCRAPSEAHICDELFTPSFPSVMRLFLCLPLASTSGSRRFLHCGSCFGVSHVTLNVEMSPLSSAQTAPPPSFHPPPGWGPQKFRSATISGDPGLLLSQGARD